MRELHAWICIINVIYLFSRCACAKELTVPLAYLSSDVILWRATLPWPMQAFERFRSFMAKILAVTLLLYPRSVYIDAMRCLIFAVDYRIGIINGYCDIEVSHFPSLGHRVQLADWPLPSPFTRGQVGAPGWEWALGALGGLRIKCTALTCTVKRVCDTLMPVFVGEWSDTLSPNGAQLNARRGHGGLAARRHARCGAHWLCLHNNRGDTWVAVCM